MKKYEGAPGDISRHFHSWLIFAEKHGCCREERVGLSQRVEVCQGRGMTTKLFEGGEGKERKQKRRDWCGGTSGMVARGMKRQGVAQGWVSLLLLLLLLLLLGGQMVLVRWVGGEARKRRYSPIDRRGCATCEASVSSRHQYIRTCSSSSSSRRAQQSRTEHSNPLCNVSRTHYMALKKKKN